MMFSVVTLQFVHLVENFSTMFTLHELPQLPIALLHRRRFFANNPTGTTQIPSHPPYKLSPHPHEEVEWDWGTDALG